ncbi:MAG: hypothetical protein GXO76_01685 [Calditrichaeota bacterium]|nr:hypothetical protein [Calditrichota bacterium]
MFNKKPHIKFDKKGLVPAIIRNAKTGEVINLVYMDRKALKKTRESGKLWLYNRSMKKVWMKGQRSGDTVDVEEIRTHVDKYSLLISGVPNGSACHTGESSCFPFVYWKKDEDTDKDEDVLESLKSVFGGETQETSAKTEDTSETHLTDEEETVFIEFRERGVSEQESPGHRLAEVEEEIEVVEKTPQPEATPAEKDVLGELYWSIADRVENPVPNSPLSRLSQLGVQEISKHLGRDVMDVTMASLQKDRETTLKESIDLLRHWILLLLQQGITLSEIYEELEKQI